MKLCDLCQRTNTRKFDKIRPELHPVKVQSPWHHLGIDLIGPLPVTERDNKYILTVSDYCGLLHSLLLQRLQLEWTDNLLRSKWSPLEVNGPPPQLSILSTVNGPSTTHLRNMVWKYFIFVYNKNTATMHT